MDTFILGEGGIFNADFGLDFQHLLAPLPEGVGIGTSEFVTILPEQRKIILQPQGQTIYLEQEAP